MFLGVQKFLIFLLLGLLAIIVLFLFPFPESKNKNIQTNTETRPTISPTPTPIPLSIVPSKKTLPTDYHVFQTFNNCGPAALSMALYLYGINVSQQELGLALRPYQNPQGDNDDKSVTLDELAQKAKEYGLIPYHRPMGNPEIIRQFIAIDIPIIARTWTKPNEDIGHFRVIKGYDETSGTFIQDDSLQGKNLVYSYADFNEIWKKFNYEYLVLVPQDKQKFAERILGDNLNEQIAWTKAVQNSKRELAGNPNDIYARFNLSVALFNTGNYQQAVAEFEKVENQLPFRTLWYQIEPIKAYFELGNYDRVFAITEKILNNGNRAFSELYFIRSGIYKSQGNLELANLEAEKALLYNANLKH